MTPSPDEWGRLQHTLATGNPVLVLGAGTHRVGYDSDPAWAVVTRRMARVCAEIDDVPEFDGAHEQPRIFLEHLWVSKLSDETRAEFEHDLLAGRVPGEVDIHGPQPDESCPDIDRVRTVLAASLLGVLFECTRCLGNVIATGAAPVMRWRLVGHPGPFGSGVRSDRPPDDDANADDGADDDARSAEQARRRAARHLEVVVSVADCLERARQEDLRPDHHAIAEERRLDGVRWTADLRTQLTTLKVGAILQCTRQLRERYFDGREPITGAVIEWLADVFWHLMVCGSGVPPSQAEMSFYANLQQEKSDGESEGEQDFRRSRPGELRRPFERTRLADDLRTLQRGYDSGLDPRVRGGSLRVKLAQTIAASLLQLWRDRHRDDPEIAWSPYRELPVVALSPDFDLTYERATLQLLDPGDALHLVVPVWRKPEDRVDWLFTTLVRGDGDLGRDDLTRPRRWHWYAEQAGRGDDDDPLRGPIFVKLNGSPLLEIGARPPGLALQELEYVEPATIFTEIDALKAIVSFAEAGGNRASLAQDVITSLKWTRRSWIFLGDSFPDWVPRLRLLYGARDARTTEEGGFGAPRSIAIDRGFDWPERGLLEALGVDRFQCDLAKVARYPREATNLAANDDEVRRFLANVEKLLDRVRPVEDERVEARWA
ncbi:MAG TPA: hypothetical protein VFU94_08365 [Conexibacter sp.]|nr:hypothetical protein [Conexibacter sp.]